MSANPASRRTWRGHAFGLTLDGSFPLIGFPAHHSLEGLPNVRLGLADRESLTATMPPESRTIAWAENRAGDRRPLIVAHPDAGYLLRGAGFGTFHVSPTGKAVRCAGVAVAPWRWQRFLIGQVLPFVSTLRGYEPWHASAVALPQGVIALSGEGGLGKSTLAAELMLGGAKLVTDDVLALAPRDGGVTAYPGPGLMSLRRSAAGRLTAAQLRQLGHRVGTDSQALRLAVERFDRPRPLSALYQLEPETTRAQARLIHVPSPDPRQLLRSTFNLALRTPERLLRQLEVCATIARTVRVVRVRVPFETDHRALAGRLLADMEEGEGGAS